MCPPHETPATFASYGACVGRGGIPRLRRVAVTDDDSGPAAVPGEWWSADAVGEGDGRCRHGLQCRVERVILPVFRGY